MSEVVVMKCCNLHSCEYPKLLKHICSVQYEGQEEPQLLHIRSSGRGLHTDSVESIQGANPYPLPKARIAGKDVCVN